MDKQLFQEYEAINMRKEEVKKNIVMWPVNIKYWLLIIKIEDYLLQVYYSPYLNDYTPLILSQPKDKWEAALWILLLKKNRFPKLANSEHDLSRNYVLKNYSPSLLAKKWGSIDHMDHMDEASNHKDAPMCLISKIVTYLSFSNFSK